MIEVVSISLGPAERDRQATVRLFGERVRIRRIGTDGSYLKALAAIREFDGQVAAMGLGGINGNYRVGARSWPMPGARMLLRAARVTPLLDGSMYKDVVEPLAVAALPVGGGGMALAVSILDRPRVAPALQEAGYTVRAGDAWFGLGLPIFPSPRHFSALASAGMPVLRRLPLRSVYGGRQTGRLARRTSFAVVWGDCQLMRRHPVQLENVSVVTSSLRRNDVEWLRRSGAARIISATPPVQGEGYGANLWEAVMAGLNGRPLRAEELQSAFQGYMGRIGWSWPFDHPELTG